MHMADALLSPGVAAGMAAASGAAAIYSVYGVRKENNAEKIPLMAVSAALVFAGQMINYTIPGTGSSGHLCGGMLLSALLGPHAGFLSMIVVLTVQCLFFADGGLMALGANIWNMAFYGCFVGYFLIWKPIVSGKILSNLSMRTRIIIASILGAVITLQLGAFSVVLETQASGITQLPFGAFAALMQPIHLAIGLVEGVITAAVLCFVYETRPELLTAVEETAKPAKFSLKQVLICLGIFALFTGGCLSLYASSKPDGLEWALFGNSEEGYGANMALDEEDYGVTSSAAETASSIQESTSFLPDYAFADSDSSLGTTVSGLVGCGIVAAIALAAAAAGKFFRSRTAG